MDINEIETLKSFITNNKSFFYDIHNDGLLPISNEVLVELIIIYMSSNIELLSELDFENKELIIQNIIKSSNYYVNGDNIAVGKIPIAISFLVEVCNKISSLLVYKYEDKVIEYKPKTIKNTSLNTTGRPCKIYNFHEQNYSIKPPKEEGRYIFERTGEINFDTKSYIKEIKEETNNKLNSLLISLINQEQKDYDINDLKLLFSIINLYPLVVYADEKVDIPYENLFIPKNEISFRRKKIEDVKVAEYESRIEDLENKQKAIEIRKEYLNKHDNDALKILQLEKRILGLRYKELELNIELYFYSNSDKIYNEAFFKVLYRSLIKKNFEMYDEYRNPKLLLFNFGSNCAEEIIEFRLSTFINLINNNALLNLFENKVQKINDGN